MALTLKGYGAQLYKRELVILLIEKLMKYMFLYIFVFIYLCTQYTGTPATVTFIVSTAAHVFNFCAKQKWHAQWDLVLLPSLLRTSGRRDWLRFLVQQTLHAELLTIAWSYADEWSVSYRSTIRRSQHPSATADSVWATPTRGDP